MEKECGQVKTIMKNYGESREEDRMYALWLSSLPGIGNVRGKQLLSLCNGRVIELYHAPESIWRQAVSEKLYDNVRQFTKKWKLQEEYEKLQEKKIGFVTFWEKEYPEKLRNIPDSPLWLYYRGTLPAENQLSVAVIGARDCSEYGKYVAKELGSILGEQGILLVSGMARGIDGISQEAALHHGGISCGVLGCGVDICYPAQNKRLYEQLLEKGAIISSYPPGTEPKPGNFPPRNRIVSGLSDAVVVIEARNKSGTLITVDMALEQGREVFAVPGRVTDRLSDGCNRLLKQGAGIFLSPEDFLQELNTLFAGNMGAMKQRGSGGNVSDEQLMQDSSALTPELVQLYKALDFTPKSMEQIKACMASDCTISELGAMLITLCMKNLVVQVSPGHFCVKGTLQTEE